MGFRTERQRADGLGDVDVGDDEYDLLEIIFEIYTIKWSYGLKFGLFSQVYKPICKLVNNVCVKCLTQIPRAFLDTFRFKHHNFSRQHFDVLLSRSIRITALNCNLFRSCVECYLAITGLISSLG